MLDRTNTVKVYKVFAFRIILLIKFKCIYRNLYKYPVKESNTTLEGIIIVFIFEHNLKVASIVLSFHYTTKSNAFNLF